MRPWIVAALLMCSCPAAGFAADAPLVVVNPPGSDTTVIKQGKETSVLKDSANGTIGKIGKDKVILQRDGRGNTFGKVGKETHFCHTNPQAGLTICK